MPELTQSVTPESFDLSLVGLSMLISLFGSLCGLICASRARGRSGGAAMLWLFGAAASIGGGAIWSMHFIGMLAYESHVVYTLDIPLTMLSLALAVIASAIGMAIATRFSGVVGYGLGGVVCGGGVAVMHYTGMGAMKMGADMVWNPVLVAVSVALAVVCATLALWFAFKLERAWVKGVAAIVMCLGVCTMHYTGMLALTMEVHEHDLSAVAGGTEPFALAMPIFGITAVLLLLLLFAGLIDESLSTVRGRDESPEPELEPAV